MSKRIALISILLLSACSENEETAKKVDKAIMISKARDLVRAILKDPDSAEFRNEYISDYMGRAVACGEVNANNSFGGKTGYQRYIAANDSAVVTEDSMLPSEFEQTWNTIC